MEQSYKIYINNITVYLTEKKKPFTVDKKDNPVVIYPCKSKSELKKIITALEIGSISSNLVLVADNLKELYKNFLNCFKIVEAGGGLVFNKNNDFLLIHRKGCWDLPKGKIEKNESIKSGSVREVEEETGVKVEKVLTKLCKTYHTYKLKDKWVLKETHWFLMRGDSNSHLIAQEEEDIDKVEWVARREARKLIKASYRSLNDILVREKEIRKMLIPQ